MDARKDAEILFVRYCRSIAHDDPAANVLDVLPSYFDAHMSHPNVYTTYYIIPTIIHCVTSAIVSSILNALRMKKIVR